MPSSTRSRSTTTIRRCARTVSNCSTRFAPRRALLPISPGSKDKARDARPVRSQRGRVRDRLPSRSAAAWLVKGNGTRTTSPNLYSESIVEVVFGVVLARRQLSKATVKLDEDVVSASSGEDHSPAHCEENSLTKAKRTPPGGGNRAGPYCPGAAAAGRTIRRSLISRLPA